MRRPSIPLSPFGSRAWSLTLIALACLPLAGCFPILDSIYERTTETREELVRLRTARAEDLAARDAKLAAIQSAQKSQFDVVTAQLEQTNARLARLESELSRAAARIEELGHQLGEYRGGANHGGAVAVPSGSGSDAGAGSHADTATTRTVAPPVGGGSAESARKVYIQALQAYNTEQYTRGAELFETYLERFPAGENAAEAGYRLGECRQMLGDLDAALAAYEITARRNPAHENAPLALFRAAEIHRQRNDAVSAIRDLKKILNNHPTFRQMDRVKETIRALETPPAGG